MNRVFYLTIKSLAAALFALVVAAPDASAVDFSKLEKHKLAAGKAVRKPLANNGKDGFYGGSGFAVINAPADVVWAAIRDWGSYSRAFPNTVDVEEVSRKNGKSLVRMELGHKLLSVQYHVQVDSDEAQKKISFQLVKNRPHDIEEARGYWKLFPQKDGTTLVAYVVAVQVPMGIVNILGEKVSEKLSRGLLDLPRNLRKWVEGPNGNRYRVLTARK